MTVLPRSAWPPKSKFGEKENVEWHSVVAFRELATEVAEKCTKGRFIRVYG